MGLTESKFQVWTLEEIRFNKTRQKNNGKSQLQPSPPKFPTERTPEYFSFRLIMQMVKIQLTIGCLKYSLSAASLRELK